MSQHTPGPWVASRSANKVTGEATCVYPENSAVLIAGNLKPENARLIAAAPDLLAALQYIRSTRGMVGKHECPGWDCAICTQGWGIIDEAIAKAEGEPRE